MNETNEWTSDQYGADLRSHAIGVVPQITVDTSGVFAIARRRRVARVGSLALVAGLALGGGGWAVAERPWTASSEVMPGGPSDAPTSDDADAVQSEPIPAEGFSRAAYWHVVSESRVPTAIGGPLEIERNEYWFGNDRPGKRLSRHEDGSSATQPLPDEIVFTLSWSEIYALPTEPEQLDAFLRGRYHRVDNWSVTEDAYVWLNGVDLLMYSPAAPAVRDAAWDVLSGLPGAAAVGEVEDSRGRRGAGLTFVDGSDDEGMRRFDERIIYDLDLQRPLEEVHTTRSGDESFRTILAQEPVEAVPEGSEAFVAAEQSMSDARTAAEAATGPSSIPVGELVASHEWAQCARDAGVTSIGDPLTLEGDPDAAASVIIPQEVSLDEAWVLGELCSTPVAEDESWAQIQIMAGVPTTEDGRTMYDVDPYAIAIDGPYLSSEKALTYREHHPEEFASEE